MIIQIDTREQKKLVFTHPWISKVERIKLDVGDYGCRFKDYKVPICFERKSIGDLFGTMGKGYERFKKEIKRAQENKITLIIIIEGSFTKVLGGYKHSNIKGISIIRKLMTLWLRHGVISVFCKDREEMVGYITEFYISAGKEYLRREK